MTYAITNFHRMLQSHLVALLDKRNKEKLKIATGILIHHNEFFLVLTAAHVLSDTSPDNLVINLGIPGQRYAMKKEKIWIDEKLDVGYMQLNTFEAKIFQNSTTVPFTLSNPLSRNIAGSNFRCALCGFPAEMANQNVKSNIVEAKPALLTATPLAADQWPAGIKADGKDPQVNFLLKYGPKHGKVINQEGDLTAPIDPIGMSGAAIFVYDPSTENEPRPHYALFGIQTGFYARLQLLVGTAIDPLAKQIELDYGPIRDEVQTATDDVNLAK